MRGCPPIFRKGFSLLELLVVIGILAMVSTLAMTSLSGIRRSSAISTSASQVLDYLATGRQLAMTLNKPVRIWFCPGETNDYMLLYRSTNGTDYNISAERELKLSEHVALSKNPTWSSLFAGSPGNETNRGRGAGYSFRYMPDGSTDLSSGTAPTLTLLNRTDKDSSTLPANYFTLQIDQQTGTIRTFRPQ